MTIDTRHLCYYGGWIHLRDDDLTRVCRRRDGADWPRELGDEPDWFEPEVAEIEDIYQDSVAFDAGCELATNAAYAAAKGR